MLTYSHRFANFEHWLENISRLLLQKVNIELYGTKRWNSISAWIHSFVQIFEWKTNYAINEFLTKTDLHNFWNVNFLHLACMDGHFTNLILER